MSFSIELLPLSQTAPDNIRLGQIRIGDFTERFGVYSVLEPFELIVEQWMAELQKLVNGSASVGLATSPNMAWILYTFGAKIRVQQALAVDESDLVISDKMQVTCIPQYEDSSADGERISEWITTVDDVRAFLSKRFPSIGG